MSSFISSLQNWIQNLHLPTLALVGLLTLAGFYFGKLMRFIRLPSIVGFMVVGVLVGPSLLGAINENLAQGLSFITEIALGFVALSIGLELKFSTLKSLGSGNSLGPLSGLASLMRCPGLPVLKSWFSFFKFTLNKI